jgi:hypothetical protein
MAQLEPLNIRITGTSEGLSTALAKAQTDTQGFGAGLGSISSRVSGLIGAAGPVGIALGAAFATITAGATAAAASVALIAAQFGPIDETAKAASRLGVSFSQLKGVRLSIGEASGQSEEEIDKALSKFELNLSEAATEGTGKAYDALKRLGLDAQQLIAAGPQKAIEMVAEKTAALKSPTDQLRVAFDLFGKSGVDVVNALKQGPEALRESYDWAVKNLGITSEQAKQVERANDLWGRVGALVESFWQNLAAEAAPAVGDILDGLLEWVDSLGGAKQLARDVADTFRLILGLAIDIQELIAFGDLNFDAGDKMIAEAKKLRDATKDAQSTPPSSESELAAIERQEKAAEEAKKAADVWAKKADSLRDSLATPMEKYEKTLATLQEALDKGGLEWEFFARGVTKAGEDLAKAQQSADSLSAPKILSATTDRAEQIRRVAEFRLGDVRRDQERERTELQKEMLAVAKEERDLLKKLADDEPSEPAPLNL